METQCKMIYKLHGYPLFAAEDSPFFIAENGFCNFSLFILQKCLLCMWKSVSINPYMFCFLLCYAENRGKTDIYKDEKQSTIRFTQEGEEV